MIPWKLLPEKRSVEYWVWKLVLKSSEKIQIFKKVGKNLDKTAEEKLVFITFSELLGSKEQREGETFPEIWKQVKITAPHCPHIAQSCVPHPQRNIHYVRYVIQYPHPQC